MHEDKDTKNPTLAKVLLNEQQENIENAYGQLYFWDEFWREWIGYLHRQTGKTYADVLLIEDCRKLAEKYPDLFAVYSAVHKMTKGRRKQDE